ncbi:MAG TPA: energy-coupling factor transporter ATPase [Oscillospiraceae bacterium]|nr:energy-coupling factor transporter ATPase [Oscillospiraceae bacterium]HPS34447.1 energy-coupling factor transporter ATPase [Oscillospiraceae bacterium]
MSIISVKDLTHIYSPGTPFAQTALDRVSFDVEKGEFLGVIGHTGSGKSTLMQMLNGLLKPTGGEIGFNGENIQAKGYKLHELRFAVGMVFQYPEYQLFEETVYKDIAFGPKNMGLKPDEIDRRVRRAAQFCGLRDELLERSPFELSGGQKRRAAIAGVIAMEPKVLILDEPAAGLDPGGRERILDQIKNYREQTGSTVLLVSHSMEEIAKYCEKVLVLEKGRVLLHDSTKAVFARADLLHDTGLDIPEITKVLLKLREMGYDADCSAYTLEAARDEVLRLIRNGGGV